ncbi:MAG: stage III sporulation protein AD [Ruminococcaceae bacterium]|nr:stage III sporulation protein AD [Oscillospiraceae bacterium]
MNVIGGIALCLLGSALCVLLAGYRPEFSMAVVVCIGAIILGSIIKNIAPIMDDMSALISRTGLDSGYFKIALKALGICYITAFAADICRDFGQTALASKAELIGKCAVFLLCVPLLRAIVNIALSFIGEV